MSTWTLHSPRAGASVFTYETGKFEANVYMGWMDSLTLCSKTTNETTKDQVTGRNAQVRSSLLMSASNRNKWCRHAKQMNGQLKLSVFHREMPTSAQQEPHIMNVVHGYIPKIKP